MPYTIEWHTPAVVIALKLDGAIELDEIKTANAEIIQMLDSVDRSITHLIADFSTATLFQTTVTDLHDTLTYLQHANIGWTALITDDRLMKFMTSIVSQMTQAHLRSFETFADAVEFIAYVDAESVQRK